jgi:hypothetical protein
MHQAGLSAQLVDQRCELRDRRILEQIAHRQREAKILGQTVDDLQGGKRVASYIQELLMAMHLWQLQYFTPDSKHLLLGIGGGTG